MDDRIEKGRAGGSRAVKRLFDTSGRANGGRMKGEFGEFSFAGGGCRELGQSLMCGRLKVGLL